MNKEEKIKIIIQILLDHEHEMTDGYDFYEAGGFNCDDPRPYLEGLAKEILEKIDED